MFSTGHEIDAPDLVRSTDASCAMLISTMAQIAYDRQKCPVVASDLSEAQWEELKQTYQVGDLTMACCDGAAIPKTSINGFPFFAHRTDECATATETIWHREAKELVAMALHDLGIECQRERDGRPYGWSWIADIHFQFAGRDIIIELQHSSQTVKEYQRRHERYRQCGHECYWLLYEPRFLTIINAMSRIRLKTEFGGNIPAGGFKPFLPDIAVALLDTERGNRIRGAGMHCSIPEFLQAVMDKRLYWENGAWLIAPREADPAQGAS